MRLTASRALGLASLARRSRTQSEDAKASFVAPGARMLLATRASPTAATPSSPAPETAASTATRQPQLHTNFAGDLLASPAAPESAWKTLSSSPVIPPVILSTPPPYTASRSALLAHRPMPPSHPLHRHHDQPPSSPAAALLPGAAAAFTVSAGRNEPGTGSAGQQSTGGGPFHTGGAPASGAKGASASVGASQPYNEPKDGSFNGRIVQHDGSHAVHLVVSGTGARDYNLRMVRCHARDELVFGGGVGPACSPGAAAGGRHGAGAGGGGGAVVRGEDVPFTTFIYRQVRDTVTATFLPAGYPDTTGQNYVRFMWWQGVNNIAVTANSVLASTFMLYAVGLGAGSIPTAGALNWVLKDGMGQLGTLLFGKSIAHNFDVHSKTWFFLSAVMLQAAAALELMTVLVPEHFLLMGSLANTLKGLAWMAAGSTRSVFHLSFARDNNIADVTAKGTSQYIFASLVGTAGGAVMCAAVGQTGPAAATCFGLLSAAAVGSAYFAVQAIPLTTLNATRLQLLVDALLDSISPNRNIAVEDETAAGRGRHSQDGVDRDGSYTDASGSNEGGDGGRIPRRRRVSGGDDGGGGRWGLHRRTAAAAAATSSYDTHLRGGRRSVAVDSSGGDFHSTGRDEDDEDDWTDEDEEGEARERRGRRGGGSRRTAAAAAAEMAGGGARRYHPRPRVYRTVDRCFIGPSIHEYEMMYDDSLEPRVPTPLELSPHDPPLPYFSRTADRLSPPITVGSRLEHIVGGNANLLVMLLTTYKYAHFMVLPMRGGVHVLLHEKADPRDMVQAYLQACILRRRIRTGGPPFPDPEEQTAELRLELQESLAAAERLTTIFMSTVEANGWTVSKIVVEAQRRRARW